MVVLTMVLSTPSLVVASERVIEISRDPWGTYFELVLKDEKAYLRTRIQEFIDRNDGSVYKGETAARVCLMAKLMQLGKAPNRFVKIKNGYTISFSAMVRANIYIKNGYMIVDLGAVEVDGKKIKIL